MMERKRMRKQRLKLRKRRQMEDTQLAIDSAVYFTLCAKAAERCGWVTITPVPDMSLPLTIDPTESGKSYLISKGVLGDRLGTGMVLLADAWDALSREQKYALEVETLNNFREKLGMAPLDETNDD
jgi:hypothetical protein